MMAYSKYMKTIYRIVERSGIEQNNLKILIDTYFAMIFLEHLIYDLMMNSYMNE